MVMLEFTSLEIAVLYAVSTIGYAGILVAPAVLGYIASYSSLYASFALVTALLAVMYVMVWHITCHREFQ